MTRLGRSGWHGGTLLPAVGLPLWFAGRFISGHADGLGAVPFIIDGICDYFGPALVIGGAADIVLRLLERRFRKRRVRAVGE